MTKHATAIARKGPSTPMLDVYASGVLAGPVLDFGCGVGADVAWLREEGIKAEGYDPNTTEFKKFPRRKFKTVLCTYVLNVVQAPKEVLVAAWERVAVGGCLFVTCRSDTDVNYAARKGGWLAIGKGWVNSRGSYQKGYTEKELVKLCTALPSHSLAVYATKVHGNPMVVVRKVRL